jgi:hypothetical protein
MNRYKPIGWRGESYRHALARRGIKTKVDYAKDLDIFKSHQKRIAIDTLRMPDAMVGVFTYGSRYAMDKNKARSFLKSIGYSDAQIENIENPKKADYAKSSSPFKHDDGSIDIIWHDSEDGKYYIVRKFPDGTELYSRHGHKNIGDAEKKRDDMWEENIYYNLEEFPNGRYVYRFPDKGTITVYAKDKMEAVQKVIGQFGKKPDYARKDLKIKQVGSKFKLFDSDVGEFLIGYEFDDEDDAKRFIAKKPDYAKSSEHITCNIDGDKVILSDGRIFSTKEVKPIYKNGELWALQKINHDDTDFAKLSSTEEEINQILFEPKPDAVDTELMTLDVPKSKKNQLEFLKAYTEYPATGKWKQYKDKNYQIEVQFKDAKDEKYGKKLMTLLKKFNKDKLKEEQIYARTVPIEESTL